MQTKSLDESRLRRVGEALRGRKYRPEGNGRPKAPAGLSRKETERALRFEVTFFAHEKSRLRRPRAFWIVRVSYARPRRFHGAGTVCPNSEGLSKHSECFRVGNAPERLGRPGGLSDARPGWGQMWVQ